MVACAALLVWQLAGAQGGIHTHALLLLLLLMPEIKPDVSAAQGRPLTRWRACWGWRCAPVVVQLWRHWPWRVTPSASNSQSHSSDETTATSRMPASRLPSGLPARLRCQRGPPKQIDKWGTVQHTIWALCGVSQQTSACPLPFRYARTLRPPSSEWQLCTWQSAAAGAAGELQPSNK